MTDKFNMNNLVTTLKFRWDLKNTSCYNSNCDKGDSILEFNIDNNFFKINKLSVNDCLNLNVMNLLSTYRMGQFLKSKNKFKYRVIKLDGTIFHIEN